MAIVCKPEEFKARVAAQLHDFSTDVLRKISKETETCSKDCVEELRRTSPRRKGKGGGAYARGWTNQKETDSGRWITTCVVHNKKHYRLTHLLENGHETRDGGRTRAIPHIKPAEERVVAEYVRRVKEAIEQE